VLRGVQSALPEAVRACMMATPMECHCIPAADVPHTTHLYSTYIENFSAVAQFYAHPPTPEAVRSVAGNAQNAISTAGSSESMRRGVAEILRQQNREFGSDATVEASLDRFVAGAVAIVSGQQVGLFSGPSYTFYKALSAIRLADELSAEGTPAVAIFWLATEDHDLAEVNHAFWPAREGPVRLELPVEGNAVRRVGEVPLGEGVAGLVERTVGMLEGLGAEEIGRALAESYRTGETYGSAFAKLFARIFAGRGLILLDPLSPELHRLAAPVYRAAIERHAALGHELVERTKALERDRFHAQVKVTESSTLLFVNVDGERLPLRARNDEFLLGRRVFSLPKLLDMLESSPELFSPNVLLRPVIQDTLLATSAYVAGPAEIAYFAQASLLYQQLQARMPVILPRASFTLLDAHAVRLLRKYGLEFSDLLKGPQSLRSKMERDLLPRALTRQFETGEKKLRTMLENLRQPIAALDPTLAGSLDTAEGKMLYQFTNLQGKVGHALSFRSSVLDAHQRELLGRLYPNGELQERSLCLLPMLASYGPQLLDELTRRIRPGGTQHQVLYL
jgi:bacillithiol biosynthesis cysteine-adding enzyme BshC